jgi:GPH family glycoside/pentoside/hexuronide:cation symporter
MLPLKNRLLFTCTSFGGEAMGRARGVWLLYTYAPGDESGQVQLLPIALASAILTVVGIIGSLDDILIGYWSDRSRSRLGRRLPFVLVGAPLWALFSVLTVLPPEDAGRAAIALYLLVTLELFNIFSTLASGPYEALLPELAPTSQERVSISGTRVYFAVAGAAVGLVVAGPLLDLLGVAGMMAIMAGLALTCRLLGVAGVWNYVSRTTPPARISLKEAMRSTFSNRAFLLFLPTFVLFQVGMTMMQSVLPYYVTAVLGVDKDNRGTWVSLLTGVAIGAMVLSIPFFTRLAGRTSKQTAFSWAMLGAAGTFPLLFFAGFLPGIPDLVQILVMMALIGVPIVGVNLFPGTLTADICDDDANRTGMRREATFFGAQNFVEKTTGSLAPLILGLLLSLGNTAEDPLGIRLVGPVAGLLVLLGWWVFRHYNLPDEVPTEPPPARLNPGLAETA